MGSFYSSLQGQLADPAVLMLAALGLVSLAWDWSSALAVAPLRICETHGRQASPQPIFVSHLDPGIHSTCYLLQPQQPQKSIVISPDASVIGMHRNYLAPSAAVHIRQSHIDVSNLALSIWSSNSYLYRRAKTLHGKGGWKAAAMIPCSARSVARCRVSPPQTNGCYTREYEFWFCYW